MVVRVTAEGELRDSRPCRDCLKWLRQYKVRRVYYSTDDGVVVSERVRDMTTEWVSLGYRNMTKQAS